MGVREAVVDNLLWGVANEPPIHYSMGSDRFAQLHTPRALPMTADCSSFYTMCCAWAGAPDPSGLGYPGYGYTGTIRAHLPVISLADALPGDCVIYGGGNGVHMVGVVKSGANPTVVSHGQEKGPAVGPHSAQLYTGNRYPFTVHRLQVPVTPVPGAPPTESKLNVITTDPTSGQTIEFDLKPDGVIKVKNINVGNWDTVPGLDQAKYGRPVSMDGGYRPDGTLDLSVKTDRGQIVRNGWPKVPPAGRPPGWQGWWS